MIYYYYKIYTFLNNIINKYDCFEEENKKQKKY